MIISYALIPLNALIILRICCALMIPPGYIPVVGIVPLAGVCAYTIKGCPTIDPDVKLALTAGMLYPVNELIWFTILLTDPLPIGPDELII